MDAGSDPAGRERGTQLVTAGRTDDVEVPHVFSPRRLDGRVDTDEGLSVPGRDLTPPPIPRVEMPKLRAQNRGVEGIEPFIPSFDDVNALRLLTETAEQANSLRELFVVRRDGAAVAEGAGILARVEAERGETAECSDTAPLVPRSVRLAGVLDERDTAGFAQLEEGIEIRRLAVQVHGDQHASSVRDSRGCRVDVDQPRGFVAIDEDKICAELESR
jgi:hypothetical protein